MLFRRKRRVLQIIDEIISVFTPEELDRNIWTPEEGKVSFREALIEEFEGRWPIYSVKKSKGLVLKWKGLVQDELDRGEQMLTFFIFMFNRRLFY